MLPHQYEAGYYGYKSSVSIYCDGNVRRGVKDVDEGSVEGASMGLFGVVPQDCVVLMLEWLVLGDDLEALSLTNKGVALRARRYLSNCGSVVVETPLAFLWLYRGVFSEARRVCVTLSQRPVDRNIPVNLCLSKFLTQGNSVVIRSLVLKTAGFVDAYDLCEGSAGPVPLLLPSLEVVEVECSVMAQSFLNKHPALRAVYLHRFAEPLDRMLARGDLSTANIDNLTVVLYGFNNPLAGLPANLTSSGISRQRSAPIMYVRCKVLGIFGSATHLVESPYVEVLLVRPPAVKGILKKLPKVFPNVTTLLVVIRGGVAKVNYEGEALLGLINSDDLEGGDEEEEEGEEEEDADESPRQMQVAVEVCEEGGAFARACALAGVEVPGVCEVI